MEASPSSRPLPEPFSGKFVGSFAYLTIKDRLPVILTKVIDSLHRERHEIGAVFGKDAKEETKAVIGNLAQLRNEMLTNKHIIPLKSNGPDVAIWNEYLEKQGKLYGFEPTWFDSPWLYTECYLYRRIQESFELSLSLQTYDPFKIQKRSSFLFMIQDVRLLCSALQESIDAVTARKDTSLTCQEFLKFVEASLWGNQCDLSISAGTESQLKSSPLSALLDMKANILVNESETLWNMLQAANCKHSNAVRVDVVLDNAGYELLTDLCLLEFMQATDLIKEAHLYVKEMPWYVSDTLTSDIDWLLTTMCNQKEEILVHFGEKWKNQIKRGTWVIQEEMFWTCPHDYSEMARTDPSLYKKLSYSDLIIFKGDLNYRKLTADRQWESETPFIFALQGFLPSSLCSLRTIKAEVVVGLNHKVKETLDETTPGWLTTGKYALIQCVPKEK